MISCTARTCFGFVGPFVLAAIATAQERQIPRSALPQAVQRTLSLESQGAAIHGITVEESHGKTYYEAELRVGGHSKDILMNADGLVVEVEEEVAMDSLPAAVNKELRTRAKNAKVVKVEAITKKDKLVAYEAQIMMDGKTSEVQVRPDGKAMEHEQYE